MPLGKMTRSELEGKLSGIGEHPQLDPFRGDMHRHECKNWPRTVVNWWQTTGTAQVQGAHQTDVEEALKKVAAPMAGKPKAVKKVHVDKAEKDGGASALGERRHVSSDVSARQHSSSGSLPTPSHQPTFRIDRNTHFSINKVQKKGVASPMRKRPHVSSDASTHQHDSSGSLTVSNPQSTIQADKNAPLANSKVEYLTSLLLAVPRQCQKQVEQMESKLFSAAPDLEIEACNMGWALVYCTWRGVTPQVQS
eukprot:TRINITY_DN2421_c0_g1_i4.p1 TRINITY_DN2421_c0_g1~~TRINITY_DN2421_c0_g1_i4.p1  ORF type:complete len:269 (+),score=14.26 TRINITY_DN2421_c0_g1_i4:55-807(+)